MMGIFPAQPGFGTHTDTDWGWWNFLKTDREIKTRECSAFPSCDTTRVFTLDNERRKMRTIFEARLLFALGLSDLFYGWVTTNTWYCYSWGQATCWSWHAIPGDRRRVTTPCYDNTDTGSRQIFDRVVNISYHHLDNDPTTMPQILTSHLIMEHCNRSEVAVEAWWWR